MSIEKYEPTNANILGFTVEGKLKAADIQAFLPEMEKAFLRAKKKLRLLIDVNKMHGADIKSEWELFEFLKHHMKGIEYIAIVGAHSWTKVMSEILADSVFVMAETRYFKLEETEDAWTWLNTAVHPKHTPMRRVISSDKGLFTKYGSPGYI
ncbi:MAG: STAS/SEC14 domain-containing protein [Candidatus Omnitrophota bacterium]|nr:STAS/SEC14 domain-containing protein [Candidatus Omnitrophota bacterium]